MKKKIFNKILVFTLCCIIASATIVNAKTSNQAKNYRASSLYCIDPHAGDPDDTPH